MAFHLAGLHFRRQYVRCGRGHCKRCPHGPYWYTYAKSQGKMSKKYVGKELPEPVKAEVIRLWPAIAERLMTECSS